MKALLPKAADFPSLLDAIERTIAESSMEESERWRLISLRRCLRALSTRTSVADRAALLRQAAWLMDNHIQLPKAGLALDVGALGEALRGRFGVALEEREGSWTADLLDEAQPHTGWPFGLDQGLKLESGARVVKSSASPDGASLRLSPHKSYRIPTQKAAIRALLTMPEGASLMVSMPTGAGKSLLFQLGAMWWRQDPEHPACVVVIVPTVGLALDHIESFAEFPGLEGARALTGSVGQNERQEILTAFVRGEVPILVMSPEIALHAAREALEQVCAPREQRLGDVKAELAAVFIDEAHIIESWGRGFRPDFQRLISLVGALRLTRPTLRVALLSATLGDEARALLRRDYGGTGQFLELHAGVPRYELDLFAEGYGSVTARDQALFEIVDRLPRPAIVYTTTRVDAARIGTTLRERGYQALEIFTGETEPADRERVIAGWRRDEFDLVVATSAFGMGIDKPDVRAVVHACLPEDAARYYQEVGRAGRDGHKAIGLCLWTPYDVRIAAKMNSKEWLQIDSSIERWMRMLAVAQSRGKSRIDATGHRVLEVDLGTAPERLGSHTGDLNRKWNRTLLNLMHRAGALEIVEVDPKKDVWTVRILNADVMDGDPEVLTECFSIRDDERQKSTRAFDTFLEVLKGDSCLLAGVFALVERDGRLAVECGHCGPCIENEFTRPDFDALRFGGLIDTWPRPEKLQPLWLPAGTILVELDGLEFKRVLSRWPQDLARQGYLQFLVPDEFVSECARVLSEVVEHPGLVMGFRELCTHRWATCDGPTVAFLGPVDADVYQLAFLRHHLKLERGDRSALLIVGRSGDRLDGRNLAQLVDVTYSASIIDDRRASTVHIGELA